MRERRLYRMYECHEAHVTAYERVRTRRLFSTASAASEDRKYIELAPPPPPPLSLGALAVAVATDAEEELELLTLELEEELLLEALLTASTAW